MGEIKGNLMFASFTLIPNSNTFSRFSVFCGLMGGQVKLPTFVVQILHLDLVPLIFV